MIAISVGWGFLAYRFMFGAEQARMCALRGNAIFISTANFHAKGIALIGRMHRSGRKPGSRQNAQKDLLRFGRR